MKAEKNRRQIMAFQHTFTKMMGVIMKRTQIFAMATVALLSLTFIAPSAWAGSRHRRHRHMLPGAAIVIEVFIPGKALHDHVHRSPVAAWLPCQQYKSPSPCQCGRWELHRVWMPPTYKRVWNLGHYNRRRRWVPGRWIEMIDRSGYWDEQRVWVASR